MKDGIGDTDWNELRRYGNIPNQGPVSEAGARRLIHGYYASVSFIDAQIGRLLCESVVVRCRTVASVHVQQATRPGDRVHAVHAYQPVARFQAEVVIRPHVGNQHVAIERVARRHAL